MPVETMKCPDIEEELVTFLKLKYRNVLPTEPISEVLLARLIGAQDVIRFLEAKHREQTRLEAVALRYPPNIQ